MPQLKCDEWPDDGEQTTTEQEQPLTSATVSTDRDGYGDRLRLARACLTTAHDRTREDARASRTTRSALT